MNDPNIDHLVAAGLTNAAARAPMPVGGLNDNQLLCLMAMHLKGPDGDTAAAVTEACEIMAEVLAQTVGPAILQAPRQPPESIVGRAQTKAHAKLLLAGAH